MTAFATAAAGPISAEPDKRVNYTLGLVLGVDEFQQDQLYHMAGRRWHNRMLHGYGTVWGLAVSTPDPGDPDPEIRVSAGVAVDPCGREICVPDIMCVRLNGWLDRHADTLSDLYPGGTPTLPVAVVLCYRECPTDAVPIPGEPCRTQEDAMQPSRIRDSFDLRLALREDGFAGSPPGENETGLLIHRQDHAEEGAVHALGELLRSVEAATDVPPGSGRDELLAAVRALATTGEAEASPPDEPILLLADEVAEAFREALRVWVTEVRPVIRAREAGPGPCGRTDGECCVLLAEVDLPVTDTWRVEGVAFDAVEDNRPVLLHTRLLQEWLLAGGMAHAMTQAATFATVFATATNNLRAWIHYPIIVEIPADAVRIFVDDEDAGHPLAVNQPVPDANVFDLPILDGLVDDSRVEVRFDVTRITEASSPARSLLTALDEDRHDYVDRQDDELVAYTHYIQPGEDGITAHGDLTDLEADDHPQYLLADGSRALAGDLSADSHRITGLGAGASAADAVRFDQAIKIGDPAGGDLAGTYPDPEVARLRGRIVAPTLPQAGQVLVWNAAASQWEPRTPDTASPGIVVAAPVPGFNIVAAGFFARDGSPVGPTFNDLEAAPVAQPAGHFNLRFRDYRQPSEEEREFMYVIKGTAEAESGERGRFPSIFEFVQFFREHIRVRVLQSSGEPSTRGFMVEISRFDVRR